MPQIRQMLEPFVRFDPKLVVELDPSQETVVRMQGRLPDKVDPAKLAERPAITARQIIAKNKALFGDIDEKTALADGRIAKDKLGMTHVVLEQKHGDALVIGGQISVHFKPDATLHLLNSSLVRHIDAPTRPTIPAAQAREKALSHAGAGAVTTDAAPLLVVASAAYLQIPQSQKGFYLCWQIDVDQPRPKRPAAWTYFVDAVEGKVLFRYSSLIATGLGVYSGFGPLPTEASGPDFVAIDDQTSAAWPLHPQVQTKDWRDSQLARDDNDNWGEAEPTEMHERMEVDIHRYLGYVLSYYHLTHGHDGWDGAGGNSIAYAHFSDPDNAYWHNSSHTIRVGDGNQDTAGSGDYNPFGSLDVLFHEFTHGVNHNFNIVQTYWAETGALNEAIADSFACIGSLSHPADEPQPWAMMERVVVTPHPRSLADPSRDAGGVLRYDTTSEATKFASVIAGYYPDHYSIRYLGGSDFAGVHCNAPIIGHAIFLMVNGGTHRLSGITVTGIGVGPVENMLFYVISTPGLLNNTSVFADFRRAMLSACQTLYPDNLDYLITVKTAFKAVGVGPDLYIRDLVGDTGQEPGATLSCSSPDIINRIAKADPALLAQMANLNNAGLCQNIEKGQDNYVYFRIVNGGSAAAGGTFRLFLSPVSTFPNPVSWNLVGAWVFPSIAPGAFWTPGGPDDCLTVPAALTNALGTIHCCFIGVIESPDDPAPDRTQIHDLTDFHDFIRKSNNYAWRNTQIVDALADPAAPVLIHAEFLMNGFGPRPAPADFEIDTSNLPRDAVLDLLLPKTAAGYLRFAEVQRRVARPDRILVGAVPKAVPAGQQKLIAHPPAEFAVATEKLLFTRDMLDKIELDKIRTMRVVGRKVTRVTGIHMQGGEETMVNFVLKLPPGQGARTYQLAFRQMFRGEAIGQMNYEIRIKPKR